MNHVARGGAARALAPVAANQSEAEKKAHQIAEIDRLCVAPVRRAREAWFGTKSDSFSIALAARNARWDAAAFVANNPPERCAKQREYLEANLAQIVSREQAEQVLTTMKAACSAKPSRNQSGVIIGRLIDSFPNARPHSAVTYRENLVHLCEVDGYSPAVVALACDAIMRDPSNEFLPAPAVFLAACKKQHDELRTVHRHAWMTLEGRVALETSLAEMTAAETGNHPALPMPLDPTMIPPLAPERSAFV